MMGYYRIIGSCSSCHELDYFPAQNPAELEEIQLAKKYKAFCAKCNESRVFEYENHERLEPEGVKKHE